MTEPKVFLSYSHDSEAHKQWVRRLGEDLKKNGVQTMLDQWDLYVGDDIGAFMEQSLKNATHIVLVCTETFAQKANDRKGGVGYEQAVFVGDLLMSQELGSQLLPILRAGNPSKALPLYLRSRLFIDFRDDSAYGPAFEQLLRGLRRPPVSPQPLPELPPVPGNTGPPRAWLLVAGTGVGELDEKLIQTSDELGTSLARSGYGVVTGGWRGVDELVSRSFARELGRNRIPLEDRLIQVVGKHELPAFPAGNLVLVERGDETYTESVKRAEAVVLIGGVGGTYKTGEFGLRFDRVVFPLADTGGDAAKFYMFMLRNWKPEFLPGIDKSKFQLVAREAPQVVAELIKLLDQWESLQTRRT